MLMTLMTLITLMTLVNLYTLCIIFALFYCFTKVWASTVTYRKYKSKMGLFCLKAFVQNIFGRAVFVPLKRGRTGKLTRRCVITRKEFLENSGFLRTLNFWPKTKFHTPHSYLLQSQISCHIMVSRHFSVLKKLGKNLCFFILASIWYWQHESYKCDLQRFEWKIASTNNFIPKRDVSQNR